MTDIRNPASPPSRPQSILVTLQRAQRSWLEKRGVEFDHRGYTRRLADNLFEPLSVEAAAEFRAADGHELLLPDGSPGKMAAPHSSSALVVNFFHYWRTSNRPRIIGEALGAPSTITALTFEARYPTGVGTRPANLDIALWHDGALVGAIESKFCEPYGGPANDGKCLPAAYLSDRSSRVWDSLAECHALATAMHEGREVFRRLDAPQLLKHAIALRRYGGARPVTLFLLWHEPIADQRPCPEAAELRQEITRFANAVRGNIDFRHISYRELWTSVNDGSPYAEYIASRYLQS